MANPIETLRKLKGRTLNELRVRGEQALHARTEQIGLSGKLPTTEEFVTLIDKSYFNGANPLSEDMLALFSEHSKTSFFQSFAQKEKTLELFRNQFGESARAIIARAERIIEGKFDLLGYKELNFGTHVDWHYEPIANKHVPLRHWKQYDELSTFETGDRKIIWELNRHQHFFTLGAAYWLTGDERFAETFALHLDEWIMQNPPGMGINWSSSLEVAFRAMSWLWAFQFFKDSKSITPILFHNALRYLFLHGRHIEKYLSTYYSPNTHLTGEALGLYYIGTQLKFFTRSAHWRKLGEDILFEQLNRQFYEDGVYFEQSTWYQRYSADFYTQFLILKTLNEGESDTASFGTLRARLQQQLDFLMHVTRPDGTTPLVGDDDGGRCLPLSENQSADFRYVLATGATLFQRGDYKTVSKKATEETLWLLGSEGVQLFENIQSVRPEKSSRGFEEGGYFVMRDGWAETDNYLLIDGGNMGALSGGHSHADTLSIDCAPGGKSLLVDIGTYTYHESENMRDYFRSTTAHNTLSIDNDSSSEIGGKFSWQTMAKARVNSWIPENRFDFFEGSHDGYERFDNPASHTRSVLFLKNDYWIIRDDVKTSSAHEYQQNFHFSAASNPKIEDAANGGFCVEETPTTDAGLRIFTFGDNGAWKKKESWVSNCYGTRTNGAFMRYMSGGVGVQEFFTFLLPTDSFSAQPEVFETHLAGGRAFVINFRGYQDLLVFADEGQTVRTEFFDTNFRFLWARISEGEATPEEYVLIDGTNFVVSGREIINHSEQNKFLTARRLGRSLNVRTDKSIFSLSLPQSRSQKRILTNLE